MVQINHWIGAFHKMLVQLFLISFLVLFSLSGCASMSRNVVPIYVPPLKYQYYNCVQIKQKLEDIRSKVGILSHIQDADAVSDPIALSSGLISLWFPVMFMSGGSHAKELAQFKGDVIALEQVATDKQCLEVSAYIQEQKNTVSKQTKTDN